ncbi:MAG: hypothetical protein ABJA02_06350 [Acidobacteriota bacterium]
MAIKLKRPTSVWVAQVLLFVFGLVFVAPLVVTVPTLVIRGAETPLFGVLLVIVVDAIVLSLFAAAFWGMFRRRQYGRWLGAAMLLLAFVLMTVGQIFRMGETAESPTSPPSAATIGAEVLIAILFLLLIYSLVFGKQVPAFFAADESEDPSSEGHN